MKKALLSCIVVTGFVFAVSMVSAQMGGGNRGEGMGGGMMGGQQSGMMGTGQGHMGQGGGMMGGQAMMGGMMQDMNMMTGIMRQMTEMMERTPGPEHMREMSDIMQHMSVQMRDMSRIMSKGEVSPGEMEQIHQQMLETQKRFDMMKRW